MEFFQEKVNITSIQKSIASNFTRIHGAFVHSDVLWPLDPPVHSPQLPTFKYIPNNYSTLSINPHPLRSSNHSSCNTPVTIPHNSPIRPYKIRGQPPSHRNDPDFKI
jgi:hypothetical protein